jgi:hypothetical protein
MLSTFGILPRYRHRQCARLLDFSTILSTVLDTVHAGGISTIDAPKNLAFEETPFLSSPNCYPVPRYLIALLGATANVAWFRSNTFLWAAPTSLARA